MGKNAADSVIDDNDIEIDLLELLYELRKRWWIIILSGVVGCAAMFGISKYVMTPTYKSSSMVYVLSKETTLTSLADLQIGSQLTEDYSYLIVSRPVLEPIIDELDLGVTYNQLKSRITIDNPTSTRILNITVEDTDPVRAKAIVDAVARESADYIGNIMEMIPPKIIETGVVAEHQSSPGIWKNTILGGMAMIVFVCGIICIMVIMDDTISTEEDIEKYLGLSVLAVVPRDKIMGSSDKEEKRED